MLGQAYEDVIKDIMTGKVLGQFFTPTPIKSLMIDLINPQLKQDGTMETIFDPAMGTGGFLITSLRHIMKQAKVNQLQLIGTRLLMMVWVVVKRNQIRIN